jgi:hypothetical protein
MNAARIMANAGHAVAGVIAGQGVYGAKVAWEWRWAFSCASSSGENAVAEPAGSLALTKPIRSARHWRVASTRSAAPASAQSSHSSNRARAAIAHSGYECAQAPAGPVAAEVSTGVAQLVPSHWYQI